MSESKKTEVSPFETRMKSDSFRLACKQQDVMEAVEKELERAAAAYPAFNSAHEGWAVLREEVDELWDEVKKRPGVQSTEKMRTEAIQVAAMAMRFVLDCCEVIKPPDEDFDDYDRSPLLFCTDCCKYIGEIPLEYAKAVDRYRCHKCTAKGLNLTEEEYKELEKNLDQELQELILKSQSKP